MCAEYQFYHTNSYMLCIKIKYQLEFFSFSKIKHSIHLSGYIYIYIYISSSHFDNTEFPDFLLPSVSIILVGFLDHIQCLHRADVSLCWMANTSRVQEFINKHCLWIHLNFSIICRWEVSGYTTSVLWGIASWICSKHHRIFV